MHNIFYLKAARRCLQESANAADRICKIPILVLSHASHYRSAQCQHPQAHIILTCLIPIIQYRELPSAVPFLIPESIRRTDCQYANRTIISMQRICKCCPKRSHTNDQNRFQNRIYLQDSQSLQYRQHNHADCQCKEYILAGKFQYMPFQDAIRRQIHCQIKRNLRNNRKSSSRPI